MDLVYAGHDYFDSFDELHEKYPKVAIAVLKDCYEDYYESLEEEFEKTIQLQEVLENPEYREFACNYMNEHFEFYDYLDEYRNLFKDSEDICTLYFEDDQESSVTLKLYNISFSDKEERLNFLARIYTEHPFTEEKIKNRATENAL